MERVQRVACKIILKDKYTDYISALEKLKLQNLSDRRQILAKRFALKCVDSDRFSDMFPINPNREKYLVKFAKSGRLQNSSVPAMQKLLNRQK